MVDLVGTCPLDFWEEWIAEGDAAGDPPTGEEWGWFTSHRDAQLIKPGDRLYIVAHGRVRGYAPVTRIERTGEGWAICRKAGAVACTIKAIVPGFRGLLVRWWEREDELPFPAWKTEGVTTAEQRRRMAREEKLRREAFINPGFDFGGERE